MDEPGKDGSQVKPEDAMDVLTNRVAQQVQRLFDRLPLLDKRLVTHQDYHFVLAGIKAATDYSFVGDVYNEDEFQQFVAVLAEEGLRVTEKKSLVIHGMKGNIRRHHGLVYNPTALAAATIDTPYAPPYDASQKLEDYLDAALAAGYNIHGLLGTIYSFPKSSIADFITQTIPLSRLKNIGKSKVAASSAGETYVYFEPAQQDVLEREALKQRFVDSLRANPTLRAIRQSDEKKASDELWSSRIPASLKGDL